MNKAEQLQTHSIPPVRGRSAAVRLMDAMEERYAFRHMYIHRESNERGGGDWL